MRGMKLKNLLAIALSTIAIGAGAAGCFKLKENENLPAAAAQVIEMDTGVVESKVLLNSEIDIPEAITIDYEGIARTAKNGVIVCPDGKIVNAGKIRLNQAGIYQVRYYFEDSGVTYTVYQDIEVYSNYFSLSNASGGEIIVSDYTDNCTDEDGVEQKTENDLWCGKDGIIVNLKSGTSFVYNKVVDLRECGEDGLSSIIELDGRYGHFDENNAYVPEVLEGWVRLTDCYNPNIYMELRMQKSVNYSGCLFPGVRTNTQPVTGMDKGVTQQLGDSRIIMLDGVNYRVWMTNGSMNVDTICAV